MMTLRHASRAACVLAVACAAVLFPSGSPHAQGENQRCEGQVTDAEGNPLKGAKISFHDVAKNTQAQPVRTGKSGKYSHNTLAASSSPGYEIRAELEGYKMVRITALTQRGDGTRVTDETYMVGQDQKGLHNVAVVPQSRSDVASRGKCVVDFVMAPEDRFTEIFHRLKAEKLAGEGEAAEEEEAALPGAPGVPAPGSSEPVQPAVQARKPLDVALTHISNREYDKAIEPARKAVADEPDNAMAHRWLGGALLQTDNLAEAEASLKTALGLDPSVSGLNFDMGMVYVKKDRPMQAIPYFEAELELSPDSATVLHNLGELYVQAEQYDRAVETFETLLTIEPDRLEYYGFLANAYKQKGDTAMERGTYERMAAQDPSGMAFYNLGNLMFNNSEMEKAADAYKRAIEQSPDNAQAHYQLGLTYVNLGKFAEAAESLETFAKLRPKDPKATEAKSLAADLRKMAG